MLNVRIQEEAQTLRGKDCFHHLVLFPVLQLTAAALLIATHCIYTAGDTVDEGREYMFVYFV